MIKSETTGNLVRHYSDTGMMIQQAETGALYSDAVDVVPCRYTYEETDTPVPVSEEINPDEAVEAVKILLGKEHVE